MWLRRTSVAKRHGARVCATSIGSRCLSDMAYTHTLPLTLLSCALAAVSSGLASAEPSPADKAALELRRMRMTAEEHERRGQHAACAETYRQIYQKNPDTQGIDEVLYNAGVCFEDDTRIGRAIETYDLLVKRFPSSRRSARALVRIGSASASIADYERAAIAYEHYAKRFPGERDAPQALSNATTYRIALGHNKKAIANIEIFVRNYKRRLKQESADAQFGLAALYEREGNTEKMVGAFKRYLKGSGSHGGTDRLLIANAKIGIAKWEESCKTETIDGSCVRARRSKTKAAKNKLPTRCSPEATAGVQVLPRSPRLAREAKKHLVIALSLSRRAIRDAPDESSKAATKHWEAAARFYSQQEDFETLLSLRFPTGLQFVPGTKQAKISERRFTNWIETMRTQSKTLGESYEEIQGPDAGPWAIAALARRGQNARHFSRQLQTASIPKEVRTGAYAKDGVDAFCHTMTGAAAPLEDLAITTYGMCLELSTVLNHFDSWSRLCESELALLRPADFPLPGEVRRVSTAAGDVLTLAPLLSAPAPLPLTDMARPSPR